MASIAVRFYFAWDRVVIRSLIALEALHSGLWLGLFRTRGLNEITGLHFSRHVLYVDAAYNASGLTEWEQAAIDRWFPENGCLLVPGCGGGRELLALAKRGHATTGFDPELHYVDQAQEIDWSGVTHTPTIIHAGPNQVPAGLRPHDACLIGWGAYTHIVGRDARIAFLRELSKCMTAGAPLLLSFWVRAPQSKKHFVAHAIAAFVARMSLNSRRPELGDWLGQHFTHSFVEIEVREELTAAGFELLDYRDTPYGHAIARRL